VRYEELKSQRIAGDNVERIRLILEHPNAIIYMSVGEAERNALKGVPLKLLPIDCVFRAKLDTHSTPNWTLIPRQTGHPFQRKLDTDSAPNWTV
jgi:hypothetical protein